MALLTVVLQKGDGLKPVELESFFILAFSIGLFSALSLPLGALTTLFWTPGDRAIAWLMAFGAGALLSAVTIDLFSPAINQGLFFEVASGAIIGSVFYLLLNHQLNQKGGFFRKSATTLQHFRNRQKNQYLQLESSLDRLTLFNQMPIDEQEQLFAKLKVVNYTANQIIYHPGDLANAFYIIQHGQVKLRDPNHDLKTVSQLSALDAFGHMAFLTNMPNTFVAQAKDDVTLWRMDRQDFNDLLLTTDDFFAILTDYFENSIEPINYLTERHHLPEHLAKKQLNELSALLAQNSQLPVNQEPRDCLALAINRLHNTRRFDLFSHCIEQVQPIIASKLKLRKMNAGQTLFSHNSNADRLYLLESGMIELIDPLKKSIANECLQAGDFFGGMAFVLGGEHISTAVARTDITFWVLEKPDFIELLNHVSALHEKLQAYLQAQSVHSYLTHEQKLSESKAQRWVKQTIKKQLAGQLPALTSETHPINNHTAAYLAIWLGIFLDGIPESLMIGSHLADGQMISISLVAALFISNYPEALSSSASMKEQGIPFSKIIMAWSFLMLLTGIGAGLGSIWLHDASPATAALISGIAAGAMLTVITETMLPEAYSKGGSIIGLVTLIGFLCAILFKVFDTTI